FFFQAEDGIRDFHVTGVQTCALPIFLRHNSRSENELQPDHWNLLDFVADAWGLLDPFPHQARAFERDLHTRTSKYGQLRCSWPGSSLCSYPYIRNKPCKRSRSDNEGNHSG